MTQYTAKLRTPADFGLALQQGRLARGQSQADVAAALGISQSAVSEIESGKPTIHIRRILEIAATIGVQLSATWEDPDAPSS